MQLKGCGTKMMNKVIVTDVDGVLLDWDYGSRQWLRKHGYEIKQEDAYGFKDRYAMEHDQAKKMVRMFNESAAIGFLTPHKDAIKWVRKLHEEHGYVFHAITSLSTDPHAVRLREQNLVRLFGEGVFEKIVCLETGAEKDEALEPYRDSDCWFIEDKTENA